MNNVKVGQFISEKRKALGMTQQDLAEKLQITNKAVSKWETGDGMPDIQLLKPLSTELGVTIDEILNGEEKAKEEQKPAMPTYCYDLPVGVVVTCILAFAIALYTAYGCLSRIPTFWIMDVYGDTFLQKLPSILISLAFGAYWVLIGIIFMCKALKIFDYKFKCEKALTIVAFVAGFVMLFAQGLDFSPINYGMFMFSFALLLGTFHGYKVPHKIFIGLAILFTFIFGISGIISVVDYFDNTSTDKIQIYTFVSRLASALIFYVFYGLLEKFSSEYEGVEE
ncbi:MAG: helix-turn-helix transcriptional regulator [Clostridia bacterium]|nr:helix-turn-helix transcriptional regulator [Clostridia bacterium]